MSINFSLLDCQTNRKLSYTSPCYTAHHSNIHSIHSLTSHYHAVGPTSCSLQEICNLREDLLSSKTVSLKLHKEGLKKHFLCSGVAKSEARSQSNPEFAAGLTKGFSVKWIQISNITTVSDIKLLISVKKAKGVFRSPISSLQS